MVSFLGVLGFGRGLICLLWDGWFDCFGLLVV